MEKHTKKQQKKNIKKMKNQKKTKNLLHKKKTQHCCMVASLKILIIIYPKQENQQVKNPLANQTPNQNTQQF